MHRLLSGVAAATLAATFVLAPPGSATAQQQPLPTTTTKSIGVAFERDAPGP